MPPPPPQPVREVVRPPNQLFLTDSELAEEVARSLVATNPAAPQNVARFNTKERQFKFEPMVDQTICHYGTDGWLLHKGTDEARKQVRQLASRGVCRHACCCRPAP